MEPKYPQVKVKLVGEDGNAFSILGRVRRAMKDAGVPKSEIDAFTGEATSGDYHHLLSTVMQWVSHDELEDEMEDTDDCEEDYDE